MRRFIRCQGTYRGGPCGTILGEYVAGMIIATYKGRTFTDPQKIECDRCHWTWRQELQQAG